MTIRVNILSLNLISLINQVCAYDMSSLIHEHLVCLHVSVRNLISRNVSVICFMVSIQKILTEEINLEISSRNPLYNH